MTPRAPIPLLVIGGPTAAGKTEASLRVAERVGGEVISADSMQIYERMDIGTGKPTPEEQARAPIHLIDFMPPDGEYTVAQFKMDAERLIPQICARGRLPIVAGGTGLYLRALTEGFDFPPPPEDDRTRASLWAEVDEVGSEAMHRRLAEADPESAERIDPSDARRIVRALEVYELTGRPMSQERDVDDKATVNYNCAKYVLTPPRQLLFNRIERRVEAMMEAGWVDEVRGLVDSGVPPDAQSMQAIGYRHIREHLDGERDLEETVRLIKRDTRRFARRQLTWLRGGEAWHWLSPADERQRRSCVAMMTMRAIQMWG
ncbi:MAG: tRNA (adenosine(37)-N6)-dimethylallyltransferase MiaA [Armatimonadia bacterium]|nr:tRNA (adenosine(37)-N6)-dimethylallyltransferase MiaA [Armatimonadia bacterium]